ncbi:acetylesterase [Spirochaetia bacterium]|nr:acetylesterase [Spirochaetia bacterium]
MHIEFKINNKSIPLTCYTNPVLPHIGRRYRPAVIVCPGGGYRIINEKEGDPVARRFQAFGMQSFLLRYSVDGVPFPIALTELASLVDHIRKNADYYDVDPDRIVICGFSAGGHLAASLAVHWEKYWFRDCLSSSLDCRPNGVVLCYPVISSGEHSHIESVDHLTRKLENKELKQYISVENYVSQNTCEVFLWHNFDDKEVKVENSLLFINALVKENVPFEAHIFPAGGHGISLCDECTAERENEINESCANWVSLAIDWIKRRI